ncbi:alpha/beta fold hydrolase [Candidatus Woesearchaeota archaeon]|nr:MAG: alpha/beta fold hydrolase [Candidatus Woesearchaeota archaeon]
MLSAHRRGQKSQHQNAPNSTSPTQPGSLAANNISASKPSRNLKHSASNNLARNKKKISSSPARSFFFFLVLSLPRTPQDIKTTGHTIHAMPRSVTEKDITFPTTGRLILKGTLNHQGYERIVILVHGYADHRNRGDKHVARLLARRGVSTLRFDLRGHGESQGKLEHATVTNFVSDVRAALCHCKKLGYRSRMLCGHSLGGLACIGAALTMNVDKLLLKAPSTAPATTWKKRFSITEWKKTGWITYTLHGKPSHRLHFCVYQDAQTWSKRILHGPKPRTETLILHGDQDDLVPLELSKRLVKNWESATLIVLEGANHWLAIDEDYTTSNTIIADWFS